MYKDKELAACSEVEGSREFLTNGHVILRFLESSLNRSKAANFIPIGHLAMNHSLTVRNLAASIT